MDAHSKYAEREKGKSFHYSVLFTRTNRQKEILQIVQEQFPKNRGRVFQPLREFWRRDKKIVDCKALFPGYLFFYTDMSAVELHSFLAPLRPRFQSFATELGFQKEETLSAPDQTDKDWLFDLTRDETFFFDRFLDQDGVERMSYGYLDPEVQVMEGPLKDFSDRIVRRNLHECLAWLDLQFRGTEIMAGLAILPKSRWFPECEERVGILADGAEVDLQKLKRRMTDRQSVYRSCQ